MALAQLHSPDLAVIDLKLEENELGADIAPQLGGRTMGILYGSGNTARILPTTPDGQVCLSKPYLTEDLIRSLEIVDELFKTGKATKPFPAAFKLLGKENSSLA